MGRTTITEANRTGPAQVEEFPALRLEKGQHSRISCQDTTPPLGALGVKLWERQVAPWIEWMHRLQAPKIDGGKAVKTRITDNDGNAREVWDMQFYGTPICFGSEAVLLDKGVDPGGCPGCEVAVALKRSDLYPVRRYAMNVVQFSTRLSPAGVPVFTVPFNAQIAMWKLTEGRFNRLVTLQAQAQAMSWHDGKIRGGLAVCDLHLGECKDAKKQNYDINLIPEVAPWLLNKEQVAFVKELWLGEGQRATDEQLRQGCGGVKPRAWVEQDAASVLESWTIALGRAAPAPSIGAEFSGPAAAADVGGALDDLMAEAAGGTAAAPEVAPEPATDTTAAEPAGDDLLGGLAEFATDTTAAPAANGGQPAAGDSGSPVSFDDLMEGF